MVKRGDDVDVQVGFDVEMWRPRRRYKDEYE
jgi:hypothetical protein